MVAKAEIEALNEEIGEWRDNMESASMEHLPKYEEVSECAEALEAGQDSLEAADLSELGDKIENLPVKTTQDTRKKAGSRAGRLGNATVLLQAAMEVLEEFTHKDVSFDEAGGPTTEKAIEAAEDLAEEVTAAAQEIQNALDELENASFPGMFG